MFLTLLMLFVVTNLDTIALLAVCDMLTTWVTLRAESPLIFLEKSGFFLEDPRRLCSQGRHGYDTNYFCVEKLLKLMNRSLPYSSRLSIIFGENRFVLYQ